jgi:hypothetical protein
MHFSTTIFFSNLLLEPEALHELCPALCPALPAAYQSVGSSQGLGVQQIDGSCRYPKRLFWAGSESVIGVESYPRTWRPLLPIGISVLRLCLPSKTVISRHSQRVTHSNINSSSYCLYIDLAVLYSYVSSTGLPWHGLLYIDSVWVWFDRLRWQLSREVDP